MKAAMLGVDANVPIIAKVEPIRMELAALIETRWADMPAQTRRAFQSALASIDAGLVAQRQSTIRR